MFKEFYHHILNETTAALDKKLQSRLAERYISMSLNLKDEFSELKWEVLKSNSIIYKISAVLGSSKHISRE